MPSLTQKLNLQDGFKFYQSNILKHVAHNFRLYNFPEAIKAPPQSPEFNPVEHIFKDLNSITTTNSKKQLI